MNWQALCAPYRVRLPPCSLCKVRCQEVAQLIAATQQPTLLLFNKALHCPVTLCSMSSHTLVATGPTLPSRSMTLHKPACSVLALTWLSCSMVMIGVPGSQAQPGCTLCRRCHAAFVALQVIDDEICFKWSEYENCFQLFQSRAQMHRSVYTHRWAALLLALVAGQSTQYLPSGVSTWLCSCCSLLAF